MNQLEVISEGLQLKTVDELEQKDAADAAARVLSGSAKARQTAFTKGGLTTDQAYKGGRIMSTLGLRLRPLMSMLAMRKNLPVGAKGAAPARGRSLASLVATVGKERPNAKEDSLTKQMHLCLRELDKIMAKEAHPRNRPTFIRVGEAPRPCQS